MGYFLTPGYHLPPVMFTNPEAWALLLGGKLVEKFSDLATNRHYACALDKIKAVMDPPKRERLNTLSAHIEVLNQPLPRREGFPDDLLPDIQGILGRNQLIRLAYTSGYKRETTRRIIEPLGLCFYGHHWHLLAYCRLREDYRDFRVDRIRTITPLGEIFDASRRDNLTQRIATLVQGSESKPACVRFAKNIMSFVGDQKYYFGLVEEKVIGSQVEMHFLTPSYEHLSHWLLSYVDTVEVVSPDTLKASMAAHAERLFNHHRPSST
jgi:predicted DNA-binding transcriptional regulator YafY